MVYEFPPSAELRKCACCGQDFPAFTTSDRAHCDYCRGVAKGLEMAAGIAGQIAGRDPAECAETGFRIADAIRAAKEEM